MPCCCTNIFQLCDFIVCDGSDLVLPIVIPEDGDYVLELDFLNDVIKKTASLSMGDNATFDGDNLNERFTYVGHLKNNAGEIVIFTIEGKQYDCIEFTTKRAV